MKVHILVKIDKNQVKLRNQRNTIFGSNKEFTCKNIYIEVCDWPKKPYLDVSWFSWLQISTK